MENNYSRDKIILQQMKDLGDILVEFGKEKLKGIGKIDFVFSDNIICLDKEGQFIRAQYFNDSKTIVFYSITILSKSDLKEVLLHELGHHFGLEHKDIKH